jgi:hypothetical protein
LVTFYDGETVLATATLDANGTATFVPNSRTLARGGHLIRAVYGGDYGHRAGESVATEVTITKTPTAVTLDVPKRIVAHPGEKVSLKATVRTLVPDLATPDGEVVFYANGVKLGKAQLNMYGDDGLTVKLPGGKYAITAEYRGSETMQGSASAATANMELVVRKLATSTWLNADKSVRSRNKAMVVRPGVSTERVWNVRPKGRVVLMLDGRKVATGKGQQKIALDLKRLRPGTHKLVAHYEGDASTKASKSERYELIVTKKTATFQRAWTPLTDLVIPEFHVPTIPSITIPDWSSRLGTSLGTSGSSQAARGGGDLGVTYSYNGDASLDGLVNADDYYRIDPGFPPSQSPGPAAVQDDEDDDGGMDAKDAFLLDQWFLGGA